MHSDHLLGPPDTKEDWVFANDESSNCVSHVTHNWHHLLRRVGHCFHLRELLHYYIESSELVLYISKILHPIIKTIKEKMKKKASTNFFSTSKKDFDHKFPSCVSESWTGNKSSVAENPSDSNPTEPS